MAEDNSREIIKEETGAKPEKNPAAKAAEPKEKETVKYFGIAMSSTTREVLSWVLTIVVAVGLALVLRQTVLVSVQVPTGSMLETIQLEDHIIGSRLTYKFSDPKRGDIVIFYAPDDEDTLYIKRCIGLPGEKIVIKDAKIYINDSETPLEEDYLPEEWTVNAGPYEFNVPEDCYLMLGDNRNDSWDARCWTNTYVTRDALVAKAEFIYFPFSDIKSLR